MYSEIISEKEQIAVFGASIAQFLEIEEYVNIVDRKIAFFIDSDSMLDNAVFKGYRIIHVSRLNEYNTDELAIIVPDTQFEDIERLLDSYGLVRNRHYFKISDVIYEFENLRSFDIQQVAGSKLTLLRDTYLRYLGDRIPNNDSFPGFATYEEFAALLRTEYEMLGSKAYYYNLDRWGFISEVISLLSGYKNIGLVLELAPGRLAVARNSDIMLRPGSGVFQPLNNIGNAYYHDAMTPPWPIKNKQYDLFVALQVWEHLSPSQSTAFREVMRISKMAVLCFPYLWSKADKNDPQYMVDEKKITEWTCNVKPTKKVLVQDMNGNQTKRLICLWDFTV